MSALPQTSTAEQLPAGTGWIDLEEAARRSGRTAGHLGNACRKKYAPARLARLQPPPEGGAAIWYVHESADPSFARVKSVEQLSASFDPDKLRLSDSQKAELARRKQLLDDWQAFVDASPLAVREATDAFCASYLAGA